MAQGADTSAEREMFRRQQLAAQHEVVECGDG